MLARLYLLLGKHPEYLTANTGERIDRSLESPIPVNGVDRTLLMAATEIDRVCGHTVMVLSGQASKPLLDALGVLDPDRIIAMYYALPDHRREAVKRDPAWAYHIAHAPDGLDDVMADTKDWLTQMDRFEADAARADATVPAEVSDRLKSVERALLRQQAGLPLSRREQKLVEGSERLGSRLLSHVGHITEEITKLGPKPTHRQMQIAMRRAVARMS